MADQRSNEPIIIIGAPSAAGKTTFSHAVEAGQVPSLADLVQSKLEFSRRDLKSLPPRLKDGKIHIIEIATQRMDRYPSQTYWANLMSHIERAPSIVLITLDIPKSRLLKNYFLRIFTEQRKRASIFTLLDIPTYLRQHWRLLRYIVTNELADAQRDWDGFKRTLLSQDSSNRIVCVRAVPSGSGYSITIQPR
jgi:adenylate kinase family enzyme